ncbi:hypothetical protein RRG08_065010 [Elysia crispata]|uniref:Uncharacterized protein n=1 Tax=Elysia crispata TaxID=231223 RepID=A0AAE1DY80_9GAST|nr:hypothetical protein RRG08_065010 [Elysia crispata]
MQQQDADFFFACPSQPFFQTNGNNIVLTNDGGTDDNPIVVPEIHEPPRSPELFTPPALKVTAAPPPSQLPGKLTYTSVPSANNIMIFDEVMYYLLDDFGLTADMGVMHRDAREAINFGTTIEYTAAISGQENVHLLSVRVPQILTYDEMVITIYMDMTDELVTAIQGENIYVRTQHGMSVIPRRPCMINSHTKYHEVPISRR